MATLIRSREARPAQPPAKPTELLSRKIRLLAELKALEFNVFSDQYKGLDNIYNTLRAERSLYIRSK